MQDLVEIAAQRYMASISTNGHVELVKTRRKKAMPSFCYECQNEIQNGIRHRFRVEHQRKGRKWDANGIDFYYLCDGCYSTQKTFMEGGIW